MARGKDKLQRWYMTSILDAVRPEIRRLIVLGADGPAFYSRKKGFSFNDSANFSASGWSEQYSH